MFVDRKDAGQKLAKALQVYKNQHVLVLAIPRGGVEVGVEVADTLNSDFSIIVSRKLPFLTNPESGFGAVAEDGSTFILESAAYWVREPVIHDIVKKQRQVVKERIRVLRQNKPLPELAGRTVILVDNGIAMGSTMRASIMMCRNQKAGKIVAAAPVTGSRVKQEMTELADECVILETPPYFRAIAQVYENWYDVSDREVIDILRGFEQRETGSGEA
ncbi:phosphoribosyltransferase [bacterium]|nr:phosphoribosyltransferase [bacterium]